MAAFPRYRLQALFDLRERAKKEAEEFYAKEKQRAEQEEKTLAQMEHRLLEMKAFRAKKNLEYAEQLRSQISTVDKITVNEAHLKSLKAKEESHAVQIDQQKLVVQRAQNDLKIAMARLTKATQEFKALEKHKEKWLKEVKKQMERKEEEAAEDISQAQYFQQSKEHPRK